MKANRDTRRASPAWLATSRRLVLALAIASASAAETPPGAEPIAIHSAAGPIAVDGVLDDPGWSGAAAIDRFYETGPGDNTPPPVRTTAYVAYDEKYLYVAVRCEDPQPSRIRASYVERDKLGGDDSVAVFLDTRNDRRSAIELRVNARGIQADGVFNDASFNADFSPDFFYDSAARISDDGWVAELRVPFSTLRYPAKDPQEWGILILRSYPREFNYAFRSAPHPRGSNCFVCHLAPLAGLTGLPSAGSLLLVPYSSGQSVARAPRPGQPLGKDNRDADAGLDVKWTPSANTALDLTLNPDFSQVEADVAQIAVNERFALFFPEERPFFLEGVDLLETPIPAVYTRTITSPRGGLRVTGKTGGSSYTALVVEDGGGGSVVLPGPTGSDFAPQDFKSWVGIGRLRHDLGRSFVGWLATGREIERGGHNWVVGPDFQWRTARDSLTGQLLWSHSRTPDRQSLSALWDGRSLSAAALNLAWGHTTRTLHWTLRYEDLGEEFRADQGFVPQVGYRVGQADVGYNFYPSGFLRRVRPFAGAHHAVDRRGDLLEQGVSSGVSLSGRKSRASLVLGFDRERTGDRVLTKRNLAFFIQVNPGRRLPGLGLDGFVGEDVDLANVRVGTGGSLRATATLRPDPHLTLDAVSAVRWLDVKAGAAGGKQRLFTAQVQRLKATLNFSARAFLRLIGQYVTTDRHPELYSVPVRRRHASFSGSALFNYRLNWQTALSVGYGDERALDERERLGRTERQLFAKLSYAWQR